MNEALRAQMRDIMLIDRVREQMKILRRTLALVRAEEDERDRAFPFYLGPVIQDLDDRIEGLSQCLEVCIKGMEQRMPKSPLPKDWL